MRRIYYAFLLRQATHPIFGYGVLLLALVWWLKELVFFARIWESFTTTPVGEVGNFFASLVLAADPLTLVVSAAFLLIGTLWLRQLLKANWFVPQQRLSLG